MAGRGPAGRGVRGEGKPSPSWRSSRDDEPSFEGRRIFKPSRQILDPIKALFHGLGQNRHFSPDLDFQDEAKA